MHIQFLLPMNDKHLVCSRKLLATLALVASPILLADQNDQSNGAATAVAPTPVMAEATLEEAPQAIDIAGQADDLAVADGGSEVLDQDTAYGELSNDGVVLDRLEVRTAFLGYFNSEQYEQAVDAGELMVEMTEQEFGPEHLEIAPALNGLGAALLRAGRSAEAATYFERSIAVYQNQLGVFAAESVDPLMGLGLVQQDLGEHDGALRTFQRAQHLTHRDKGVNNLQQISIIQARSQSYMAQDKWTEAENLQLLSAKLYRRNYGTGNAETIPAMHRLARWYHDIMDYRQARIIYRQTVEMIKDSGGGESPAMIPALKGIAGAYLEERSPDMNKGLRAHEKIVEIADNYPGYDIEDRILAHLELGDWYVLLNTEDKAWEQYRIGWELSVEQEQDLTRDWAEIFDRPHLIYPGSSLSVDFMGYGVVGKEVYYDFQFTIGRDGKPKDINVLGSNLHGQTRVAALHAFRYARFRPRMVDGATVATANYKVRRVYPTFPPDDYATVRLGGGGG